MTEFENKLLEVLADIKTELTVMNAPENLRKSQRQLLKLEDAYDRLSVANDDVETKINQILEVNLDLSEEEFNSLQSIKHLTNIYDRNHKMLSKFDDEMELLNGRGCIGKYSYD